MRLPSAIQATGHGFIRGLSTFFKHQPLAFGTLLSVCVSKLGGWSGSKRIQMNTGMTSANFSIRFVGCFVR